MASCTFSSKSIIKTFHLCLTELMVNFLVVNGIDNPNWLGPMLIENKIESLLKCNNVKSLNYMELCRGCGVYAFIF